MDLLVEKLDGSRYYLSQYKVLITDFEESAPSVTRNSKQLDQRNGNIDFGGWHTDKTINITGYYRAEDIDEEETLREKLYALLSDPDGYYITQLKTTPNVSMERPGETSGGYYDKLSNYPSHKRFLVYTEAPEMELVGNVNGTLLYKLTAEFKTMKLPYGESVPHDLDVKPNVPYYSENLVTGTSNELTTVTGLGWGHSPDSPASRTYGAGKYYASAYVENTTPVGMKIYVSINGRVGNLYGDTIQPGENGVSSFVFDISEGQSLNSAWVSFTSFQTEKYTYKYKEMMITRTPSPWSPAPSDPGYNKWYFDTYYNTKNIAIPYAGTVPCNQLEQGFTVQLTAAGSASSLSFKIDDNELTYSGAVAKGDVFMFSGFSYTQNGLSIVSKTNKEYFILHPDKPNRITCNVPGTVRIIGFQNLYA